ncbi:hypothetical protein BPAE_0037g00650 [Botrytis paeoniae]|uniref:Uncharacterized protein n=1 Tax=Botrytis paeoniae TaxID=278948 RepID=A0A4Z1FY09_9HELO|nr:hypothetical protein BPAE_0037g00650 [Botrytis paeoniae]
MKLLGTITTIDEPIVVVVVTVMFPLQLPISITLWNVNGVPNVHLIELSDHGYGESFERTIGKDGSNMRRELKCTNQVESRWLLLPCQYSRKALTMTAHPFSTSTMRRTLQAVLSRRTSIFPQSYCNSHFHYFCCRLNKRFSSVPQQSFSQKRAVSNITTPNSTNDSNPDLKDDGHWAELIKEVIRGQSASSCPVNYTGSVAYRTCYDACDSTRWDLFRRAFDALVMETWEEQAKYGVDPDDARFLWKMW